MKKLMALAIVSVVAASTPSWAIIGMGDIKFDGSLEVSGNSANNETDFAPANDHRGNTTSRVRLGMDTVVTEGVNGRLEVTRTAERAGSGEVLYGGSSRSNSVHTESANLFLDNAYVEFENLWNHKFRLGRQYVGQQGDLIWHIGPKSDDSLSVTSIDGLRAECTQIEKWLGELFVGKLSEDDAVANSDAGDTTGDVNLGNLSVVYSLRPEAILNAGFLWGVDSNTASASDNNRLNIIRVGSKGGFQENLFTYRAEYLQNSGALQSGTTDYKGSAIDIGFGFNPKDTSIGNFGLWLNYVQASGDDKSDKEDKSFHDFSTFGTNTSDRYFGEIYGRSNTLGGGTPSGQGLDSGVQGSGLVVLNFGFHFKPAKLPKNWVRFDYFNLKTDKDVSTTLGDKLGNELDITFGYDQSNNVKIVFGYAQLTPDSALIGSTTAPDDDVTKFFARANVHWGGEDK
ncbi:MAG: hypothetical protein ACKVQC_07675 [Elusimicrobiota bacterium]